MTNNANLIAEARIHFPEPGYEADVDMIQRLADALEIADARIVEMEAGR